MTDNNKVLVFAGTTEGRLLTEYLAKAKVYVHACVITDYGKQLIEKGEFVEVSSNRLGMEGMCQLMKEYPVVVDATHPYAVTVTDHIKKACAETGAEYIRLLRPEGLNAHDRDLVCVPDVASAVEYLKDTEGNILAATGSKEIEKYTAISNYKERVFARVLSLPEVVVSCAKLGFEGRNLICMQGPFNEDINYGMMKQFDIRYMVTKDSGRPGGFDEKIRAAKRANVKVILVGRPADSGMTYDEVVAYLGEKLDLPEVLKTANVQARKITIVGIGMGTPEGMTVEAVNVVSEADLLVGAKRMIESVCSEAKDVLEEYSADRIMAYVDEHKEYSNIVVLVSGDVGFYSAAKNLIEKINDSSYELDVKCGISSMVYMCSRLHTSWQDACPISAHGRDVNVVGAVRRNKKVFSLLNGSKGAEEMCSQLIRYGLDDVTVTIGQDLGCDNEIFITGHPSELKGKVDSELCVALIENQYYSTSNPIGIPDEEFIRGDAPMTKSEVRALSVAKLKLCDDSVVYDVGAGTGSVSVEMALVAVNGKVYAVEKEEVSIELIEQNKLKFKVPNLDIRCGFAPEALEHLPAPTHVFIGGSSGNLKEILQCILKKNSKVRIVINSVTLETLAETSDCIRELGLIEEEITNISVSKARKLGKYHLMTAQNPVYIAVCRGPGN